MDQASLDKVFSAEKRIAGLRLVVVLSGTIIYPLLIDKAGTIPSLAYGLLGLAWVYGLYVYFAEPYRRHPLLRSSYFTSVSDAVITMLWLYATGGVDSPFYVALYMAVVGVAFRYSSKETAFAAIVYSGSYVLLLASLGQVAGHVADVVVRVTYLFLAAGLGALVSGEVLDQERSRIAMRGKMVEARVAEERLRAVLEAAPDAMAIVDPHGKLTRVNGAAERLFGQRRDQLLGQPLSALLPDCDPARLVPPDFPGGPANLGGPFDGGLETLGRRKDGTRFPAEVRASPLDVGQGVFLTVVIRDVTERKRQADALKDSEERWRSLVQNAPDNILLIDREGKLLFVNRAVPGVTVEELLGRSIYDFVDPARREWMKQIYDRVFETARPQSFEVSGPGPQGRTSWYASHVGPVKRDGKVVAAIVVSMDITPLREAEQTRSKSLDQLKELERLKEVDQFKTQFVNTAAHELATPLTPIKLQLHLLRKSHRDAAPEERERMLEILDRNVDRVIELMQDVLEAARLQASRFGAKKEPIDLNQVVVESAESFEGPAKQAGVELSTSLAPDVRVEADAHRITQVLYNLLTNALKFTARGGRISVETGRGREGAVVLVHDSGAGLSAEQIERLFQPFSQVHGPLPGDKRGSGLGLYICKGIVELHGGRIWCESQGHGLGSTFAFVLPWRGSAARDQPREEAPTAVASSDGPEGFGAS